jgi:hypothetical protein
MSFLLSDLQPCAELCRDHCAQFEVVPGAETKSPSLENLEVYGSNALAFPLSGAVCFVETVHDEEM